MTAIIYQYMAKHPKPTGNGSLRLDKWLRAARFLKTRTLAVKAASGGKIHLDGQRIKPSRQVRAVTQPGPLGPF
jgi:ribosomal 50S subunit-recycling heat shock protein